MGLTAHGDDPSVTNSLTLGVGTIGTNAKNVAKNVKVPIESD